MPLSMRLSENSPFAAYQDRFYDEVLPKLLQRRLHDTSTKITMQDIAIRYNGDYVIPVPDAAGEPDFPPLAATVMADSIESSATRANDNDPHIRAPATSIVTEAAQKRARNRRRAWHARWHQNQLPLKLGRAYRHHFGFSASCMLVAPDLVNRRASIATRNPIYAYPEPMEPDEIRRPLDIGFIYGYSGEMLRAKFEGKPGVDRLLAMTRNPGQDVFDVVEWWDTEFTYVGILGIRDTTSSMLNGSSPGYHHRSGDFLDHALLISASENRLPNVPVVCSAQITLDRQISAIKRALPISDLANKIAALQYMAIEKAVVPDRYVIGAENRAPILVSGRWQDGRTGHVNLIQDATAVGELRSVPGPMTPQMMADMERIQRLATNTPSVLSGEMNGSIRSGQTVSQLQAASVDPRLKEAHRIFSYVLTELNHSIAETELAYFPNRKYTVFTGLTGDDEQVTFTPRGIWEETTDNAVVYPMPGMDSVNATLSLSNMLTSRLIGRRTAREKHPEITDPEAEDREVIVEEITAALLSSIQQGASSGTMAKEDVASLIAKLESGTSLHKALLEVQREAQKRQVTEAPPPGPGQLAAPETAPGINPADTGSGAEMPMPGAGPAGGGGLAELFAALGGAPGGGPGGPM